MTNYALTSAQGSIGLTGAPALRDTTFTAVRGSFVLTGRTANLARGRTLVTAQGGYALTVQNAGAIYSGGLVATLAVTDKRDAPAIVVDSGTGGRNTLPVGDRHVRRSGDEYRDAFLALLPNGQAWPKHAMDSVLWQACDGLNQYWGSVDSRAADLLERESNPGTTIELLPDWERNWGLPDPCYTAPLTIGERQQALLLRMTIQGAQSREFFVSTAAYIGYTIHITEFRPFRVGMDRCGDNRTVGNGAPQYDEWGRLILTQGWGVSPVPVGQLSEWPNYGVGGACIWYWTVHVDQAKLVWFRCASGQCGVDPHLRIGLADDLECLLNRWKPAHTRILFDYSGQQAPGDSMAGTP